MADDSDDPSGGASLAISPNDRDVAIRTMIGEEGTPQGQAGVASTMLNRATSGKFGGNTLTGVAFAPSQFESWTKNSQKLWSISPDSPEYQKAAAIFDGVASGDVPDFTNGATHFYAPAAQAALGRAPPKWSQGQDGTPLGKTVFYAPGGSVSYAPPASPAVPPDAASKYLSAPSSQSASVPDAAAKYLAAPDPTAPDSAPIAPDAASKYLTATPQPDASTPSVPSPPSSATMADATASGFANGVPIVGPMFDNLLNKGVAGIQTLAGGKPYAENLAQVQAQEAESNAAHPVANKLAGVAGAVVGSLPVVVAAAPEAFGIGGASLGARVFMGGVSGAALSGADAVSRSEYDHGYDLNAARDYGDAKSAAIYGAAGGALGPVLGAGIGAGVRQATNLLSSTTPAARSVGNILSEIGMSPQEAQQALTRLGPNGILADVDPALTTEAGALAARGGATTSTIKNAMYARSQSADSRASQMMEQNLGPKPDLEAAVQAIKDDSASRAGPSYQAGRAGAPMDVTPVLGSIDSQMPNASGSVKNVLQKVKDTLTSNTPTAQTLGLSVPKSDPGAILGARQALDDLIEKMPQDTSGGRNAFRTATDLRNQIDSVVKSNPDFAAGDAIYAKNAGIIDAMKQGTQVFQNGTRPQDLARTLAGMSPEEVAAHQVGARSAIADTMESSKRGELAAAQTMFGKGTANRAKLDQVFPGAQDTLDALHGEATMRNTERQLISQSVTAERQAAMKRWAGAAEPGPMTNALMAGVEAGQAGLDPTGGAMASIAYRGGQNLLSGIRQRSADRFAGTVSNALTSTGAPQAAFMKEVARSTRTAVAHNSLSNAANAGVNLLTRESSTKYDPLSEHQ